MVGVLYFSSFVFSALAAYGFWLGGLWSFLGLGVVLLIHPLVDTFVGRRMAPAVTNRARKLSELALLLQVPALTAFFIFSLSFFSTDGFWVEQLGFVLSTGAILGALGITSAHELVHRTAGWQRAAGVWLLALVNYSHFRIEHVYLHHVLVGTPEDASTARRNESLYKFAPRHFLQGLVGAHRYEKKRIKKKGLSAYHHRLFHYLAIGVGIGAFIQAYWGWAHVAYWLCFSAVAYALLIAVDYIEHYGLMREKSGDRYQALSPRVTWDCGYLMTNLVLFNLGYHSHHHAKANVRFWGLENGTQSWPLPYGYSVMILLALVPPLFRAKIHPILDQAR